MIDSLLVVRRGYRLRPPAFACGLALLMLATAGTAARADTTISVSPTSACTLEDAIAFADGGSEPNCTNSNGATGTTTIDLASGTYDVTGGQLALSGGLPTDIVGQGEKSTIISASGSGLPDFPGGVLTNRRPATTTVSGVTLTGGSASSAGGGGIDNESGATLTLNNDIISQNETTNQFCGGPPCFPEPGLPGGGIANFGTLSVNSSQVTGNTAGEGEAGGSPLGPTAGEPGGAGGGLFNAPGAAATVVNSTISGNGSGQGGVGSVAEAGENIGEPGGGGGAGGGIENQGTMTISDSTISGNQTATGGAGGPGANSTQTTVVGYGGSGGVGGNGGGIDNSGTLSILNSTVTGNNAAGGAGGGVGGDSLSEFDGPAGNPGLGGGFSQTASTSLDQVTVAFNGAVSSGGGLYAGGGTLTEINSIVDDNTGASNVNCALSSPGQITDGGNNIVFGDDGQSLCPGKEEDPLLDSTLANNGGPTLTLAIENKSSPAIGIVPSSACTGSDQRGVTRQQPEGCDAGAYEYAPPVIGSPAATVNSTMTATVSAMINPEFSDANTSVLVNYGTTSAYGATTPPQTFSNTGDTPTGFSASLTGLTPGSTYHYDIVARNGDGQTSTGDGTFTTPSQPGAGTGAGTGTGGATPTTSAVLEPLASSFLSISTAGDRFLLDAACAGGSPGEPCSGSIELTSHVTTKHGARTEVSALANATKKKPPKTQTTDETVGSGSYSVGTGDHATIKLALNATGRKLLDEFYKLPATLTITGPTPLSRKITFSYAVINAPVDYNWAYTPTYSSPLQLTVSGVPAKGAVEALCHGGGCPFRSKRFTPKHGGVALTTTLSTSHLAPGATLTLEITAPNDVGKVVEFSVRSGQQPTITKLCLPPGAGKPSACI